MTAGPGGQWLQLSSLAWGGAFAWAAVVVIDAVNQAGPAGEAWPRVDEERARRLRASSRFYRRFEPAIAALAPWNAVHLARLRGWVSRSLLGAGEADWRPEEFLGALEVQGAIAAAVAGLVGAFWQDSTPSGVLVAFVAFGLWSAWSLWSLHGRANNRRAAVAARLPYAVDLVALILEAGGHFLDAVGTLVREMERHPLADELGQVHRSIRLGIPHHEALKAMSDRVGLPPLSELVTTIVQGEVGGTPLAEIFRVQAEQMRIKRSQAIEKATAKAIVHMVYPGLISMVACMMIMAAQFVIWMASANGAGTR